MVKPIRSVGWSLGLRVLTAALVTLSAPVFLAPATIHAQALPNLGGGDSAELSPLQERKLGEDIMNGIRRDPAYMSDLPTLDYLNQFGNSLLAAIPDARGETDYDFFFFAVRDPTLNAFALPGGFIGANSGLVLAAQSESELASVMAHEIGHVSQRHIARMIGNQKQDALLPIAGLLLGALAMRASPDLGMAAMMGGTGVAAQRRLSFGRDAEREADRIGLNILNGGGFEATGMVNFLVACRTLVVIAATTCRLGCGLTHSPPNGSPISKPASVTCRIGSAWIVWISRW